MNKTYLNEFHQRNNGHLVDFAGWEMPINYGSQINEHNTVRADVGIFDVSHMACLLYTSPSPRDGLLSRMPSSA